MPYPRPWEPKPERVNAGIRFSVALYERIRRAATRRRVSINRLVEWAVEDWLNSHNEK
jgi:predicted HicB family RNase H-like nuclease